MAEKKKRIKPCVNISISKDNIARATHNPDGLNRSAYINGVLTAHFKKQKSRGVRSGQR